VTKSSSELFGVLNEIEERIHDVHIAAWGCERIWLSLVNEVELEGVIVPGLGDLCDSIRNRLLLVIQRRGFDDFAFGLQLVKNFLTHLQFFVRTLDSLGFRRFELGNPLPSKDPARNSLSDLKTSGVMEPESSGTSVLFSNHSILIKSDTAAEAVSISFFR